MSTTDAPISSGLSRDHAVSLLKSGNYSDFTITCGNQKFMVHKCIITDSSEYFRAAVDGGFSESSSNHLVLQDTTPQAVAVTIVWLYTKLDYLPEVVDLVNDIFWLAPEELTPGEWAPEELEMTVLLDTYLLADRLMLPQLKEKACLGVGRGIQLAREDIDDDTTDTHRLSFLVKQVYEKIPETDALLRPKLTSFLVADECMPHNLSKHTDPTNNKYKGLDMTEVLTVVEEYDPVGLEVGKNLLRMFRTGDIGVHPDRSSYTSLNYWR